MIIKVCGMTRKENIAALQHLDVDLVGLIFAPQSPRYVGQDPDAIYGDDTPIGVRPQPKVGVFVNEELPVLFRTAYRFFLSYVQLHGDETPAYVSRLRSMLPPSAYIIKTISVRSADDVKRTEEYDNVVDYFLFDTKCPMRGGSGCQFDWDILHAYSGCTPFLLSGGIGEEDAARIKGFRHPEFAGIDLNSKFETAPGVKDIEKLKAFIAAVRS